MLLVNLVKGDECIIMLILISLSAFIFSRVVRLDFSLMHSVILKYFHHHMYKESHNTQRYYQITI